MRRIQIVIMTTFLISLFTACSNKDIFSEDIFLKYTYSPAGECRNFEFFDRNVEVSSDGTVRIYCDNFDEKYSEDYPTTVIQLSAEDIAKLKKAIAKNRIMFLPRRLSTQSCDGSYSYLTVYSKNKEHITGGLNVDNKSFQEVEDMLWSMIGDDFNELIAQVDTIQEQGYKQKSNSKN
jgi:hypothetical protein